MGKGLQKWLRQNNIKAKLHKPTETIPPKPVHISHPFLPDYTVVLPAGQGGKEWQIDMSQPENSVVRPSSSNPPSSWLDFTDTTNEWQNSGFGSNKSFDPRTQRRGNFAGPSINRMPYGNRGHGNRSASAPPRSGFYFQQPNFNNNEDYGRQCQNQALQNEHQQQNNQSHSYLSEVFRNKNDLRLNKNRFNAHREKDRQDQDLNRIDRNHEREDLVQLEQSFSEEFHRADVLENSSCSSSDLASEQNNNAPDYYEKYRKKRKSSSMAEQNFDPRECAQPVRTLTMKNKRKNQDERTDLSFSSPPSSPTPMDDDDFPSTSSGIRNENKDTKKNDIRPFTDTSDISDGEEDVSNNIRLNNFLSKKKRRQNIEESYRVSKPLPSILKKTTWQPKRSRIAKNVFIYDDKKEIREYEIDAENEIIFERTLREKERFYSTCTEEEIDASLEFTKNVDIPDPKNKGSSMIVYPNRDDRQFIRKRVDPKKTNSIRLNKDHINDARELIVHAFDSFCRSEKNYQNYIPIDWWLHDSLFWYFNERTVPRTVMSCFEFDIMPEWVNDILEEEYKPNLKKDVIIRNIYYTLGFDMLINHADFDGLSAKHCVRNLLDETRRFIEWVMKFFQQRYIDNSGYGQLKDEYGHCTIIDNIKLESKYQQIIPTVILLTIPEIGPLEHLFSEFNEGVRSFVQTYQREYEEQCQKVERMDTFEMRKANKKPQVELIDWAELSLDNNHSCVNLNERFRVLMKEAHERFGLIRTCDRRNLN